MGDVLGRRPALRIVIERVRVGPVDTEHRAESRRILPGTGGHGQPVQMPPQLVVRGLGAAAVAGVDRLVALHGNRQLTERLPALLAGVEALRAVHVPLLLAELGDGSLDTLVKVRGAAPQRLELCPGGEPFPLAGLTPREALDAELLALGLPTAQHARGAFVDMREDLPGARQIVGVGDRRPRSGIAGGRVNVRGENLLELFVGELREVLGVHYWPPSRCWAVCVQRGVWHRQERRNPEIERARSEGERGSNYDGASVGGGRPAPYGSGQQARPTGDRRAGEHTEGRMRPPGADS